MRVELSRSPIGGKMLWLYRLSLQQNGMKGQSIVTGEAHNRAVCHYLELIWSKQIWLRYTQQYVTQHDGKLYPVISMYGSQPSRSGARCDHSIRSFSEAQLLHLSRLSQFSTFRDMAVPRWVNSNYSIPTVPIAMCLYLRVLDESGGKAGSALW